MVDKEIWLAFGVKQIIDPLSFHFLLTHIGLNNRANHENLDLSLFLSKIELIRSEKRFETYLIFCFRTLYIYIYIYIYTPAPPIYIYIYIYIYRERES